MPKPADWNEVPRRLSLEIVADAKRCGACHGLFAREDRLGGWIGDCSVFHKGLRRVKGEWERHELCLNAERTTK
jgi:hypothetical protein